MAVEDRVMTISVQDRSRMQSIVHFGWYTFDAVMQGELVFFFRRAFRLQLRLGI